MIDKIVQKSNFSFPLFAVVVFVWVILCQLIFFGVQRSVGGKILMSIQNQFRQELDFSNFHYLSRSLIDYQRSGVIKCTLLARLNPEVTILDQRQPGESCDQSSFLRLNGETFDAKLKTLNGDSYRLTFVSQNDLLFYICLWTLRIFGLLLLVGGFYIYYLTKKAAMLKFERELALVHERQSIAKQVAHDIRSPLSALTMVAGTLKNIPEDRRVLIRNATQRINDIANDLLLKSQNNQSDFNATMKSEADEDKISSKASLDGMTIHFIPALVDVLVSEKRMQYREHAGLEIDVDLKDSFGSFSIINSNELKRVISNLVNNAVEAFEDHQGKVVVGVRKTQFNGIPKVEIFVKDNGKGIPQNLIKKIGEEGVSFGKMFSDQSGSGLGLSHARKTAESFSGGLEIESIENVGTTVRFIIPLVDGPKWFADKVDLTDKKLLVSLDDDVSIHQIWSDRLQRLDLNKIAHVKFQSSEVFEKYVNANINKLRQTLFLVDYELLNQPKTGLDVIEDLGIEKYSILVTSRYEEPAVQDRAIRLSLPILPKALAGFVPIEGEKSKEKYDWVLVDDDDLVHMSWSYAAKETNSRFIGFKSKSDFEAYKCKIDPSSNIYIDSSLGEAIRGEEIAKKLFEEGFRNIYLATGYSSEQFQPMDFIRAIVGKEPPTVIKNN